MIISLRTTLVAAGLLVAGLGAAGAAPGLPQAGHGLSQGDAIPVAMCGYSCRRGGRYIPGPPSVCYEEGLNYCGSSRDVGPRRFYDGGDRGYVRRYERYERY
ncbi:MULTISPECIES: hypothetical protein [Methylobacterium]|uniref:hypothetical protein n=1 Tax=Methylobacterium TaxID=407 RepID=UPI001045A9E6|nr:MULTISPECIES: hypothetical protein [Methylobacterium]MDR7035777.1 hypothetical protein [Methylobacterium sp. BE186]